MSRYIGKRVSYPCSGCGKQFTLNRKSVDTSLVDGKVFCSAECHAQHHAHLTPETQPQSQAVVNASALDQSDSDTTPAQAQVA